MIYIGTIKDINSSKYNEVWIIVHSPGEEVQFEGNIKWVPELAPSTELFSAYRHAIRTNTFDSEFFYTIYAPQFLTEMKNEKAVRLLNKLYKESFKKEILLACFCENETLCHRSLVIAAVFGMHGMVESNNEIYYSKYEQLFKKLEVPFLRA